MSKTLNNGALESQLKRKQSQSSCARMTSPIESVQHLALLGFGKVLHNKLPDDCGTPANARVLIGLQLFSLLPSTRTSTETSLFEARKRAEGARASVFCAMADGFVKMTVQREFAKRAFVKRWPLDKDSFDFLPDDSFRRTEPDHIQIQSLGIHVEGVDRNASEC